MGIIRTQKEKAPKPGAKTQRVSQSRPTKPSVVTAAIKSAVTKNQNTTATTTSTSTTGTVSGAWWVSDIAFIVEGKRVQAHKVVLSSRSKYFATLFLTGSQNEIEITEFSHATFSQFIRWVYAGSKEVSPSVAVDLKKCAELYDVPDLLFVCEQALASFTPLSNLSDEHLSNSTPEDSEDTSTTISPNSESGMNTWSQDPILFRPEPAMSVGVAPSAIFAPPAPLSPVLSSGMEVN